MWEFDTVVSEIVPRTPTVTSFRFPIRSEEARYQAGQFFFVTIVVNETEAVHTFSFSSSPTEKEYLEFSKRMTSSDYSRALAAMEPGAWAHLRGPAGSFTLPQRSEKLAFLTGGIGITPMRSMLRYIVDKGLPHDVVLLYSNSSLEETTFREELDSMALGHEKVRVEYVPSGQDLPPGWTGKTGRIDKFLIVELIPDYRDRLFYLCGPPGMVVSLQEALAKLDVPKEQIRQDSFTGYE
jgi:ferredoxin-NADP reductase